MRKEKTSFVMDWVSILFVPFFLSLTLVIFIFPILPFFGIDIRTWDQQFNQSWMKISYGACSFFLVAIIQWYAIQREINLISKWWIAVTTIGFLLGSLSFRPFVNENIVIDSLRGLIGGLVLGLGQWVILKNKFSRAWYLVPAYAIPMSFYGMVIAKNSTHRVIYSIVFFIILGVISGKTLDWLFKHPLLKESDKNTQNGEEPLSLKSIADERVPNEASKNISDTFSLWNMLKMWFIGLLSLSTTLSFSAHDKEYQILTTLVFISIVFAFLGVGLFLSIIKMIMGHQKLRPITVVSVVLISLNTFLLCWRFLHTFSSFNIIESLVVAHILLGISVIGIIPGGVFFILGEILFLKSQERRAFADMIYEKLKRPLFYITVSLLVILSVISLLSLNLSKSEPEISFEDFEPKISLEDFEGIVRAQQESATPTVTPTILPTMIPKNEKTQ
ncbi:hypothetical protein U27_06580 [Candidatus Vecturithrix granuli]|uniref:Uncharacterized protein n=1 Tax=Vecturithrix granuli TaxID=1499967 RepID=A0A081C4U0_VECG1|nr:hypothetical protein U27_06580 [Candidatus Vecturithrix granuli]